MLTIMQRSATVVYESIREILSADTVNDANGVKDLLRKSDELPRSMRLGFRWFALHRYEESFVQSPSTDDVRTIKRQLARKLNGALIAGLRSFDSDTVLDSLLAECSDDTFELAPIIHEFHQIFLQTTVLGGVPAELVNASSTTMQEMISYFNSRRAKLKLVVMGLTNRVPRTHSEFLDHLEHFLGEDPIPNDLIAWLTEAFNAAELDPRGFILEFLTALTFNPVPAIYCALFHLGQDADLQDRLRASSAERGSAETTSADFEQFFAEVMRLHLNLVSTGRIVEGKCLIANLHDANRDPLYWPEPDKFDIDRKVRVPSLTFGSGHRSCPGKETTKLAMWAIVRAILRSSKGHFSIANPEDFRVRQLEVMTPELSGRYALRGRFSS